MKKTMHPWKSNACLTGYKPELSEGAIQASQCFLTSTFVFKTAEEGK